MTVPHRWYSMYWWYCRHREQKTEWRQILCKPWVSSSNCAQPFSVFRSSACGCITILLLDWITCWTMGADCFRNPASCFSELGEHGSCTKYISQSEHTKQQTLTSDLGDCLHNPSINTCLMVNAGNTGDSSSLSPIQREIHSTVLRN